MYVCSLSNKFKFYFQMSSESEWSGINYIDWEDLQMDTKDEVTTLTDKSCNKSDSSEECIHSDSSEWESDDSRWKLNLQVLKNRMQHDRINAVLNDSSWTVAGHDINLRTINNLLKEPVFPRRPSSNYILQGCSPSNKDGQLSTETVDIDFYDSTSPQDMTQQYKSRIEVIDSSSHEEYQSSSEEYVLSQQDINNSDSNSGHVSEYSSSDGSEVVMLRPSKKQLKKSVPSSNKLKKPDMSLASPPIVLKKQKERLL